MHDPGMSHTVIASDSANFLQFLLYYTPHCPLSLLLLLAAHPPRLIPVQLMGNKRNLCYGSHRSSLVVSHYATAGGHSSR
jgi:hypothetical protein